MDDLIDLAIAVREGTGFDAVNCSSNTNYSVNEMYDIAQEIMGKRLPQEYASDAHYWANYPALYGGAYPIREEILSHEINKYSLCDNSRAREKYGWTPKVSMRDGLKEVITHECALLSRL